MSQKALSMRKIKEVLRLRYELGLLQNEIARSCRSSRRCCAIPFLRCACRNRLAPALFVYLVEKSSELTTSWPISFRWQESSVFDPHQRAREVRASVLRSRGIEVDTTDSLQAARSLWQSKLYDLIMLDARGYIPGEVFDFYFEVKHANPLVRVVFLVGPPTCR